MNLLVCKTSEEARHAIEVLDMDKTKWRAHGAMDALVGSRFDKIVVMMGGHNLSRAQIDWFTEVLPLKLPPNQKVQYL